MVKLTRVRLDIIRPCPTFCGEITTENERVRSEFCLRITCEDFPQIWQSLRVIQPEI
jgi:hypothetical protein